MKTSIYFKSTVTGKRQITIPKEICEIQNIDTGDQVVFKEECGKIIFEKEQPIVTCFACKGNKAVTDKTCFICRGEGFINKALNDNYLEIFAQIAMTGRRYGVSAQFIATEVTEKGIEYKDFPTIILNSDNYSRDSLNYIQDEIQKKIIQSYTPRSIQDNNLFICPSDDILKMILNNLATEDARNEVMKWFRYDRTQFFK